MSKHVATTKEERKLENDNSTMESKFFLEQAAQPIRPYGTDYLGSFCVHIYASGLQAHRELMLAVHTDTEIPEQIADMAIKELREKAMESYGRKVPKRLS